MMNETEIRKCSRCGEDHSRRRKDGGTFYSYCLKCWTAYHKDYRRNQIVIPLRGRDPIKAIEDELEKRKRRG